MTLNKEINGGSVFSINIFIEPGRADFPSALLTFMNRIQEIDNTCKGTRILCINAENIVFKEKLFLRAITEKLRRCSNKVIVSLLDWGLTEK